MNNLVSEDKLLDEIRQAKNERDNAQARYDAALKQACKQGLSYWRISAHVGVSYDSLRMYVKRRGWT